MIVHLKIMYILNTYKNLLHIPQFVYVEKRRFDIASNIALCTMQN
jgi:hypothetical protein